MTQSYTTCYNRLSFRGLVGGMHMLQFLKGKKLLEITLWTHTNVVRSVGYGLDTVCHLQLDFYIHQLNLCWIFNLDFKFS